MDCDQCGQTFRNHECYRNHLKKEGKRTKSICELVKRCQNCDQLITMSKGHRCPGTKKCRYCKEEVTAGHDCFIPTYATPEEKKPPEVPFIFYDFECEFEGGEHKPNFCVAQRACDQCIRGSSTEPCPHCDILPGNRQVIFRGESTLDTFCTWLFQPLHKGATAIAHNSQGYDAQFILRHVITVMTMKPELIMNGSKIVLMKVYGVRLIDSLSFLSMPLAAFPKTFGLTEMAKGYFPFWANTKTFQNYVGPYLPLKYYKPDSMKPEARQAFMTWYKQKVQDQETFDFQKEMERYCISDVELLRRGCGAFRHLFMESDGIDPFLEATTLAQACNKAWRKNSMPEKTLGIIPDAGYPHKTRYSMTAIRWLQSITLQTGIPIQHALNGGEAHIGPYTVDGFNAHTNTVYEFLGCFYHGCPTCYPKRETMNPYSLKTMDMLWRETNHRLKDMEYHDINVISVWECDFDKRCKADPAYGKLIDSLFQGMDPIQPREALFGGRTNAARLYFEVDETQPGQEIKYADICSLYPYVNKYKAYPVGHPEILTREQIQPKDIRSYHGLIKCKVLPPQDVWMPVLPLHCQNKMVFTLCRTCAEQQIPHCTHNPDQRALVGTWTSIELNKVLDVG